MTASQIIHFWIGKCLTPFCCHWLILIALFALKSYGSDGRCRSPCFSDGNEEDQRVSLLKNVFLAEAAHLMPLGNYRCGTQIQCSAIASYLFACLFAFYVIQINFIMKCLEWKGEKLWFFSLEETKINKKFVFFLLKKFRSLNTFLYSIISLLLDTKNVFQ